MKKINLVFVMTVLLLVGFNLKGKAQSKADVVACVKKVLDVEDSALFFQFDTPKANTAIILRERELARMKITDEDFRYYNKNVRIWGKEDLFMRGIRENKYLCLVKFAGSENEMSILMTTFVRKDNDAFYQAAFVLNKQGDEWEISNQNFNRN